ncbi:hypothetical protein Q1695_011226 [Nippostrongylus brasiliensis]|nr:hypothetical protein Q1695_011226 [Nippostrongylus brasiliensis]
MAVLWSQWIFMAVNAVSLPPYILILIIFAKEWKQNHLQRTFYLLFMSQSIVDLLVMGNYFIFWTIRTSEVINWLFWQYRHYYLAAWCFNQTYISVIIRCFGVLLGSFQRYLSMCKHGKWLEQMVNTSHRWTLPVLHWLVPILYSIPLLCLVDVSFASVADVEVMAPQHAIVLATSMTALFVCITFILCSCCYVGILDFLIRNRHNSNVAVKREARVYVQMMGLFVAFMLLFVYDAVLFVFSLRSNDGSAFTMRIIFPVISCFFSYVNVWMMIALNEDIRKKILMLLGFRRNSQMSVAPSFTTRALPMVVGKNGRGLTTFNIRTSSTSSKFPSPLITIGI